MRYFDAYLMLAEVREEDEGSMPPGLRALAIRTPPPPGKPDTGVIFFREIDREAFGRILEAVWLDRHAVAEPQDQRKLFLVGDGVFLQTGTESEISQVGGPGPIRGAIEGLRDYLDGLLESLSSGDTVRVTTPLGEREARYLEVRLPEPGYGGAAGAE